MARNVDFVHVIMSSLFIQTKYWSNSFTHPTPCYLLDKIQSWLFCLETTEMSPVSFIITNTNYEIIYRDTLIVLAFKLLFILDNGWRNRMQWHSYKNKGGFDV